MNIVLSTAGLQALMDAQTGGYKLEIGTFRAYRSNATDLPFPLTTASLDANVVSSWTAKTDKLATIDEYHASAADIFHMVCTIPSELGDFDFDAIVIYLTNGVMLGAGVYERVMQKRRSSEGVTSNILEIEAFIRFTSVSSTIQVTRERLLRPYSYISEYDKADSLGDVSDNMERIYRVTRPNAALGANKNAFSTFLVNAGIATFDNQGKTYQKPVWVPSDHVAMFGSEVLPCRILTDNTLAIKVNKAAYPMVEHIQTEVAYLVAITDLGNTAAPAAIRGRLLEAVLNVIAEGDGFYEILLLLPNSTFADTSIRSITFGATLYANNSDLLAHTAVKVALRKFLELQYAIGRTYKGDADINPNDVLMPHLGYRTYWQKLNGIVEASVSTTDGRMASAGQVYDMPDYATGGETLLAPVLRATNIWLRYDPSSSGSITYDLSADRSTVNEGGTVRFTLRTTGLTNGSLVAYNVTGIQAADLESGELSGYFQIANNVGTVDLILKQDELTEGDEDLRLSIVADPSVFKVVTVRDTSTSLNANAFFGVSPTATTGITQMNEGDTRYFIATVGGIPDGTYLYPMLLNTSVADIYDLSQAIPSSVRVTEGRVSFPVTTVADKQTEGDELLAIGLYRDAQRTKSLVSATVTIKDTSKAASIRAFFSDSVSGANDITGTTVNEGSYVYLIVETTGYPANSVFNLRYGNSATPSAVEVDDADFASVRPMSVTLDSNGRGVIAYPIANDYAKDREDPNTLETFNVEVLSNNTSVVTVLARSLIYIKDTSTLDNGAFTLADITDAANPTVIYNSSIDSIASIESGVTNGTGLKNGNIIGAVCSPLDLGLNINRRYRLTWIQSETASSAVTRAMLSFDTSIVRDAGAGIGSQDVSSATSGKQLSMIKDSNGTTLGYGAVFEFEVYSFGAGGIINNIPFLAAFIVKVFYPNGAPGATYPVNYVPVASDKWVWAKQTFLPVRNNSQGPLINNLYSSSVDPKYSLMSKEVCLPLGSMIDLLVITPSGSGATSSLASSGTGIDGEDGRTLAVHVPQYLGSQILKTKQSIGVTNGQEDYEPIYLTPEMLWSNLITITGGTKGKSQSYDQALTNLGGMSGNFAYHADKNTVLTNLQTGKKLFARAGNQNVEYEFICEVIHVVTGKDYQKGKSTATSQDGGLGFLPDGLPNSPDNIRGRGGKGGASIGTGFGYGGGGGSGSIYILRLGTKILSAGYTPSPSLAPVSFYLSDITAIGQADTAPINSRLPFYKAQVGQLTGANMGVEGTELFVSQLSYAKDAYKQLGIESKIGGGTSNIFIRPTHNARAAPNLPLKEQNDWPAKQLSQLSLGRFGISRIVMMPTGVEGSYANTLDEQSNGKPSKATSLMLYSTLEPNGTPNETVGSTFVYTPPAPANVPSTPVLNVGKLANMQNTVLLDSKIKSGDNSYSLGGMVDLFIANNSTLGKVFIADMPRVDISNDNPLKIVDPTPYNENEWYSAEVDADGNSLSSEGYMIASGDGAIALQKYSLSTLVSLKPWVELEPKAVSMTNTDAPIILMQGESVTLTVIAGGGGVSTRESDPEVTTPDTAFNGMDLILAYKLLAQNAYTDFLTAYGGEGSIDNSTNPTAASNAPTLSLDGINQVLTVVGTPELLSGASNPLSGVYGGAGSGSYAKITLMNFNPQPVIIKARGGKGGSDTGNTDGVVLITVN